MKTRNGFVSNSSSSSFVVRYKVWEWENKSISAPLLTPEEVKMLTKQGFTLSNHTHPSHVENCNLSKTKIKEDMDITMVKSVSCNQDDEIGFLLSHNIPFTASVHYGHQHVIFEKGSKHIYILQNYGCEAETYQRGIKHHLKMWKMSGTKPITKLAVKKVLKEYERWNNEDGNEK